tara:strand:- start:81868 stop:83460 length:1593 start_codon:yes stop_codon:yes gene_type:complete
MLNFFHQPNAQLLIVNNRELQFFVWENKNLKFISEFDGSQQSLEAFKQLQNSYKQYPAIFVTNFLEESFRSETIAPVSGGDRKALLARKLDYAFRKTPYRTANILDKEKDGRKDNKVLLSGLTKPELLTPWIKILLANRTPIQSIGSAAYLSEAFVQNTGLYNDSYLLIASLENNFELRQTFMLRGKVLFSRLTSLSSRDRLEIGKEIYKESVQIRSYLERVKLLPYEETLKINIYSVYSDADLQLNQKSSHLNSFENINIQQEITRYQTSLTNNQLGSMIFFLCVLLQKKKIKNTYAPPAVRKYFLLQNLGDALSYGALLLIALSLVISTPLLLESWDFSKQQTALQAQTQPLVVEYDILSQRFPATPIPSQEMALVVESTEQIINQSFSPTDAMAFISSKLVSSPALQLTEITWSLESTTVDPFDLEAAQMRYLGLQNDTNNSFKAAILDQRTALKVSISGMAYSSGSYREAQQQVQLFADALEQNSGVTVTPVIMPTNVRVDTEVTTTIDNNELRAPFVLQLDIEYL